MGNIPSTESGGFVSVKDAGAEKTPFRDEKSLRWSYWFMILGVMLFILATWGLSMTSYAVIFWQDTDASVRHLTKDNKSYDEFKNVLMSSIAFGAATCVFLIIMIALYFLYLEQNFLFAERLSNELTIAAQGPDRLKKVAGLMSSYVYPKGQEAARAKYADDLLEKLRGSYQQENKINPLTPEEYQRLYGDDYNRRTGQRLVGGRQYPERGPSPEDYRRETYPRLVTEQQQRQNYYEARLSNLRSGINLPSQRPPPAPPQRGPPPPPQRAPLPLPRRAPPPPP